MAQEQLFVPLQQITFFSHLFAVALCINTTVWFLILFSEKSGFTYIARPYWVMSLGCIANTLLLFNTKAWLVLCSSSLIATLTRYY